MFLRCRKVGLYSVLAVLTAGLLACGQEAPQVAPEPEYVEGELILKFSKQMPSTAIEQALSPRGLSITKQVDELGIVVARVGEGVMMSAAMERLESDPNIEYVEPNYIYHTMVTPNDPRYNELWGMRMIDAPQAWDQQTGSESVIVGIIDTGINYEHEDLAANMWRNPGESGDGKENNGVDDDNNGFVDDVFGWDFVNDDNDPRDDNDHGSHVSGTVGAVGNNGKGVVGVNWNVRLMALKFLDANGSGSTADAVDAIIYATNMGAKVLNNSWGGGGRSRALEDAIRFANERGVLFVAAAGNAASDNDTFPSYPASYDLPNVVAVAASTENDGLASFSNFGRHTVHLAAPGTNILSSVSGGGYNSFNGTSMATPHVAGAAALVWAQFPGRSMNQIKIRLLGSVERNGTFADRVTTGGRLNVNDALSTSPLIHTRRLDDTTNEQGPYVVLADAVDDSRVEAVTLTYQVDSQAPVTVDMTPQGNDRYLAEIPGQSLGSNITYSVTARDDQGNETRGREISFRIGESEEPPDGGICGQSAGEVSLEHRGVQTAVNASLNLLIFVLPIAALGWRARRRRER